MKINQVNFAYSSLEDRLLFRFNTQSKTEFRMWLTRAMSIKLLGYLHQLVKIDLMRNQPGAVTVAMEIVGEFRREAVLAKADYEQSFSSEAMLFPLGIQPVLVTDITMEAASPVSVVTFKLAVGQMVNLSLNHDLGVAICKLLSDVVDGVSWGVNSTKELPATVIGNYGEKMMLH